MRALHAIVVAAALSLATASWAQADVAGSLYHLNVTLTNQDGQAVPFARWAGRPVVVALFYSSCQFVCPMIAETIKQTEATLTPGERVEVKVLMVSFDPARDSVEVLHHLATQHGVDTHQWTFARAPESEVRRLAAALHLQYRKLPNGDFNHSSFLTLLDRQGRIAARTDTLGDVDPAFMAAIRAQLGKS